MFSLWKLLFVCLFVFKGRKVFSGQLFRAFTPIVAVTDSNIYLVLEQLFIQCAKKCFCLWGFFFFSFLFSSFGAMYNRVKAVLDS